jgi:AcrR family transcriptional regulator
MSAVESDAPRPRTPRREARQNVLRATLALLAERDPDHITVRDIAERAGHHHRFIQDWFGGKTNLFAEAFHEITLDLAAKIDFNRANPTGPDPLVVRSVRLMNWLVANEPTAITGDRMRPVINRLQHLYEERFGIDTETARLLAQRMMFLMTGVVLFKDAFGLSTIDVPRQIALEFEIAHRLGTKHG